MEARKKLSECQFKKKRRKNPYSSISYLNDSTKKNTCLFFIHEKKLSAYFFYLYFSTKIWTDAIEHTKWVVKVMILRQKKKKCFDCMRKVMG